MTRPGYNAGVCVCVHAYVPTVCMSVCVYLSMLVYFQFTHACGQKFYSLQVSILSALLQTGKPYSKWFDQILPRITNGLGVTGTFVHHLRNLIINN